MVPCPAPSSEFTVAIDRPPFEHRIRLAQIAKWAESTTRQERVFKREIPYRILFTRTSKNLSPVATQSVKASSTRTATRNDLFSDLRLFR